MNFDKVVSSLSDICAQRMRHYATHQGVPFPSAEKLAEIVQICRSLIFPGFYGRDLIDKDSLKYHIGVETERLFTKLSKQIVAGKAFTLDEEEAADYEWLWTEARQCAQGFVESLPELRRLIEKDVEAHFRNDPAAHNNNEVILCYPGLKAIFIYRLAHRLVELGVPLIPRMIAEIAHSETGIDINPEAQIGESFAIDHGTGVVIGATCIIGNNVTIYQGVTLGAKNFPQNEDGSLVKGVPRHPILGNNVIVYANATILGRVTIGDGCVVGGNLWLTHDVPAGTKLFYNE